ncbi:hypothetical protein ISS39_10480 [Candidatus Bathyarchaeota archaeon]|nr:hypothetical protein [Candidatus Bathyarchaeota archaeon]
MDLNKLSNFLTKYFKGLHYPKISEGEGRILVEEIVAGVEVLLKKPEISYDDWWDELHVLCDDWTE